MSKPMRYGKTAFLLQKEVAAYIGVEVKDIDRPMLEDAIEAVTAENNDYWDALANKGQIHGNAPYHCVVAWVYEWLKEDH